MKMKIMFVIGAIMLFVANIGGVGYGLYLWGGTGMAFGLAVWTAFKFWIIWIVMAFVFLVISFFTGKNKKDTEFSMQKFPMFNESKMK
jgi:hypothetical protein